jgi:hypothetical protein
MQCGARVDDERQVRSGVGNERDKAVYRRGGGEGKETNLQGQARAGLSFKHTTGGPSGTRETGGREAGTQRRERVPRWDLIEPAPSGSLQVGDSS